MNQLSIVTASLETAQIMSSSLRQKAVDVPADVPPATLRHLIEEMLACLYKAGGVGLAAPQVGINQRVFVMNATGKPEDDCVYVNPVLSDAEGEEESEEGCLSLPQINVQVWRSRKMHIAAQDLTGQKFAQEAEGYLARIWQHEFDHLNGMLLTDRMGPVAKLANRRILKDLEEKYATEHPEERKPRKRK